MSLDEARATLPAIAGPLPPPSMRPADATVRRVDYAGAPAWRVDFAIAEWPQVLFAAPEGTPWDWRGAAALTVALYNPTDVGVPVAVRVDNADADGYNNSNTTRGFVPPQSAVTLTVHFKTGDDENELWGMRGVPGLGPRADGTVLDLSRIVAFQVFVPWPKQPHTLLVRGFDLKDDAGGAVPLPFVDRFGQYLHEDWPGKLGSEEELRERRDKELAARLVSSYMPQDYLGWVEGPRHAATGWFRTEEIDGVWWLISPEGRRFFSIGATCVGTWERTFVEGREDWFAWLPPRDDPRFGGIYQHQQGAHSNAGPIDGSGDTFGFYVANLIRKYGDDWRAAWRTTTEQRLKTWGFNTLANWSQADIIAASSLPYVVSGSISGVPPIAGATGYWKPMFDVFDDAFAEAADRTAAALANAHGNNPRCIGYFVDNELAWDGIDNGLFAAPPDQPCRQFFVRQLQQRYGTLDELNAAWRSGFDAWDAVAQPRTSDAFRADRDRFLSAFADRYYATIAAALRRHAPNQLYLGSRFSVAPDFAVQAAARHGDVVSFNFYTSEPPCARYLEYHALGKPIMIGEFHFGALDRGMFHGGLSPVADQAARAEAYAHYVQAAARCPNIVGCHWFQYVDEPITGRWFDGENYNIGLVDVTDTPYPELTARATEVNRAVYRVRTQGA